LDSFVPHSLDYCEYENGCILCKWEVFLSLYSEKILHRSPSINTLKLRKFVLIHLYLIHLTTLNMRMDVFYVSVKYFFSVFR
jgi:hypothetical protein